jgi:hypothetical protein
MGCFDTYWSEKPTQENYNNIVSVQMKNGLCILKDYWPGCSSDIPNGVYISYDGVIVIADGKVILVSDHFTDKWSSIHKITSEFEQNFWKLFKGD